VNNLKSICNRNFLRDRGVENNSKKIQKSFFHSTSKPNSGLTQVKTFLFFVYENNLKLVPKTLHFSKKLLFALDKNLIHIFTFLISVKWMRNRKNSAPKNFLKVLVDCKATKEKFSFLNARWRHTDEYDWLLQKSGKIEAGNPNSTRLCVVFGSF